MKSAVIVFPGSNRDRDMIAALEKVSGSKPLTIWHADTDIPSVDLIVLPGGFSYGDYLRTGAIAARAPIMRAVAAPPGEAMIRMSEARASASRSGS